MTNAIRVSTCATRALQPAELPTTESLKTTLDRVLPYWNNRLARS